MDQLKDAFIFSAAPTSCSPIFLSFLDSLLVVFLSQLLLLNLFIHFAHISSSLVFFLKIPPSISTLSAADSLIICIFFMSHPSSISAPLCSLTSFITLHSFETFFPAGWLTFPCAAICFHRWMHSSFWEAERSHPGISLLVALATSWAELFIAAAQPETYLI